MTELRSARAQFKTTHPPAKIFYLEHQTYKLKLHRYQCSPAIAPKAIASILDKSTAARRKMIHFHQGEWPYTKVALRDLPQRQVRGLRGRENPLD
jgi:hypothetical protein